MSLGLWQQHWFLLFSCGTWYVMAFPLPYRRMMFCPCARFTAAPGFWNHRLPIPWIMHPIHHCFIPRWWQHCQQHTMEIFLMFNPSSVSWGWVAASLRVSSPSLCPMPAPLPAWTLLLYGWLAGLQLHGSLFSILLDRDVTCCSPVILHPCVWL